MENRIEKSNSVVVEELRRKWNEIKPVHRVQELAWEGCFEYCHYDLWCADDRTVNAVMVACLDSIPRGDKAAMKASAKKLFLIGHSEGWL